jgi:hypothetical protein
MIVGGGILLALIVALVMPKERADQISESVKRISGDPGIACLDYQRKTLKDPESARLIRSSTSGSSPLLEVHITYRATNSYGAFVTSDTNCTMNSSGEVDERLTDLKKASAAYTQDLDSKIACLKQKVEDRKQGNPMTDANFAACELKSSLVR